MIIRKIKKFFYNRGLDRKINYIEKFVTGKCSYKDIDPELDAMEKDVAVILINLLDNAVNASRNSKEKKIKLNIFIHNQMYNIICKNSIDKSVLTDNPYLHTSKRDKNKHGLGILGIQRKLDEYGGIVDFCEEEGYFVAHIMIPCQEDLV